MSPKTMQPYIDANRLSWATLAEDHYHVFKRRLETEDTTLNPVQIAELGDIAGKSLIHLQCNTGADTLSLARLGAQVTGVDLVPENIHFAKRMAQDLGFEDAQFFTSNVLELMQNHHEQYDIVFTTEGLLCWLPDLDLWARNLRHVLADYGFVYVMDGHPFFMVWDEEALPELKVKYPYFQKNTDEEDTIGGYAAPSRPGKNYSWMYTMGEIITALSEAGLHVEWLHEFDWLYYRCSAEHQQRDNDGQWRYPEHRTQLPYTFSLKAGLR